VSLIYAALKELDRQEQTPDVAAAPAPLPARVRPAYGRYLALALCVGVGTSLLWPRVGVEVDAVLAVSEGEPTVPERAVLAPVIVEPIAEHTAVNPAAALATAVPVAVDSVAVKVALQPELATPTNEPEVTPLAARPLPAVVQPASANPPSTVTQLAAVSQPVTVALDHLPSDPPPESVSPLSADAPSLGLPQVLATASIPSAPPAISREQRLQAARDGIQVQARREPASTTVEAERAVEQAVARFTAAMQAQDPTAAEPQLLALEALLPAQSLTRLRMRAWWLSTSARAEEAAGLYEQILARRPGDAGASINLALLQADIGHFGQARHTLARLPDSHPEQLRVERYIRTREGGR
jgi:hypothetical protein